VLSPLVILVWLVPGFRDFSETAIKTYITTIFTLFVHVVILMLAASLFTGMSSTSGNNVPDTLMAMIVGLATIMALLKTQGVMMQFSYVSGGARNARKLGGQFMNGVSYMTGKGKVAATKTVSASRNVAGKVQASRAARNGQAVTYNQPRTDKSGVTITRTKGSSSTTGSSRSTAAKAKTGSTTEAPKVTPRSNVTPLKTPKNTSPSTFPSSHPKNNSKDKVA